MRLARLLTSALALTLAVPLAGCGDDDDTVTAPTGPVTIATTTFAPSLGVDLSAAGWTQTQSGLYYRTLGTPVTAGTPAVRGQPVRVRYAGWLANGTQFDAGIFPFTLGAGQVIAGWDEGIVGMRVGERRRLLIPPTLGYGASGNGPIPGNAVLVFDVELLPSA